MNLYLDSDPVACAWLRMLVSDGVLAGGEVWCRDIRTVEASEVAKFTQRHWFCGIGGWPYALQLAGWPENRPVDTASLPCQPFSAAGRQKGTEDERHLWPEFLRLVAECRPRHCFGEQVASKLGREWLAGVRADLEGVGYAVGAADLCAPGVGAPHLRQRLYWVADRDYPGHSTLLRGSFGEFCPNGVLRGALSGPECGDPTGRVADREQQGLEGHARDGNHGHEPGRERADAVGPAPAGGGTGHWSNAVWLPCRDGKNRRAKPGIFPLVDGIPRSLGPRRFESLPVNATPEARKMRLKGYGNAIIPQLAAEFVKAFVETRQ